jgi:hypothetical protein
MNSQSYIPDALPLNRLDHRLLLPLVGQANAALARYEGLMLTRRRGILLEESETATREFVERGLHFRLHKTNRGVYRLHNFLSGSKPCASVSARLIHPRSIDYAPLLAEIKARVRRAQTRAVLAVNAELIRLYWEIDGMIHQRQRQEGWGQL